MNVSQINTTTTVSKATYDVCVCLLLVLFCLVLLFEEGGGFLLRCCWGGGGRGTDSLKRNLCFAICVYLCIVL